MNEEESGEAESIEECDEVSPAAAAALHNLLDARGQPPVGGESLPPLWHWLSFLPRTAQRDLGTDGHPQRSPATFPDKYPQRMFAGARITFLGDILVGQPMTRRSRTLSTVEKSGRSGALLFTAVENIYEVFNEPAIVEVQDIVYRTRSKNAEEEQGTVSPISESEYDLNLDVQLDPTLLFRFSALTYNAHRIHYDLNFATGQEGYPGLVVHGPLQAIYLAELCRRHVREARVTAFEFKALRPMFSQGEMRLRAKRRGSKVELSAFDRVGQKTMLAMATLQSN